MLPPVTFIYPCVRLGAEIYYCEIWFILIVVCDIYIYIYNVDFILDIYFYTKLYLGVFFQAHRRISSMYICKRNNLVMNCYFNSIIEQCSERQLWEPRWEVTGREQIVASSEQLDMMIFFSFSSGGYHSNILHWLFLIQLLAIMMEQHVNFYFQSILGILIFYSTFLEIEK